MPAADRPEPPTPVATSRTPDGPGRWPEVVPVLIDTARGITLRAHTAADLPRIVEQSRDPESIRWTTIPTSYTPEDARRWVFEQVPAQVAAGVSMVWAIEAELEHGPVCCGSIELRWENPLRAEVGYGLHPAARGRGVMSSALRMAVDWAFASRGVRTVSWLAQVGNWPSRWAAEAVGFRMHATLPAYAWQRGELHDAWLATRQPDGPTTAPPRLPPLCGGSVRLREFTDSDLPRIREGSIDPLTQQWMPELPTPDRLDPRHFLDWCREGVSRHDQWTWCLSDESDQCLGAVTLFRLQDEAGTGELGYWTHPEARGRGLTSQAVRMVADFALGPEGAHQALTIRCAQGNAASAAVAEKAGFTESGRLVAAERLRDGQRMDLRVFSRVG